MQSNWFYKCSAAFINTTVKNFFVVSWINYMKN